MVKMVETIISALAAQYRFTAIRTRSVNMYIKKLNDI